MAQNLKPEHVNGALYIGEISVHRSITFTKLLLNAPSYTLRQPSATLSSIFGPLRSVFRSARVL